MSVGLLAPWVSSWNLGDHVIGDAVVSILHDIGVLPTLELSTHARPKPGHLRRVLTLDKLIFGGTNALSSSMLRRRGLTADLVLLYRHKVVLMGVGWAGYQHDPAGYARWLWETVLDPTALHSVRDEYSADKLTALGLRAINTGCPSTWTLGSVGGGLPYRIDRAVVTVTDYAKDPELDTRWIRLVADRVNTIEFQPMSAGDNEYLVEGLRIRRELVRPLRLASLNAALSEPGVLYVGTRLHAGIRALQMGCPTVILAVDNRASEMSVGTGLPIVPRSNTRMVSEVLESLLSGLSPKRDALSEAQREGIDEFLAGLRWLTQTE